jgi:hypothetical protein
MRTFQYLRSTVHIPRGQPCLDELTTCSNCPCTSICRPQGATYLVMTAPQDLTTLKQQLDALASVGITQVLIATENQDAENGVAVLAGSLGRGSAA